MLDSNRYPSWLEGLLGALLVVLVSLCGECAWADTESSAAKGSGDKDGVVSHDTNQPTIITSDTLDLDSRARKFIYRGNVKVVQGDMTLTCLKLEGFYDENSEITEMIAYTDVVIIKGENLEARGQKAVYSADEQLATITENPQIIQGQSALVADVVKVYLDTEKTLAEGQVQMKIIKDDTETISESG